MKHYPRGFSRVHWKVPSHRGFFFFFWSNLISSNTRPGPPNLILSPNDLKSFSWGRRAALKPTNWKSKVNKVSCLSISVLAATSEAYFSALSKIGQNALNTMSSRSLGTWKQTLRVLFYTGLWDVSSFLRHHSSNMLTHQTKLFCATLIKVYAQVRLYCSFYFYCSC